MTFHFDRPLISGPLSFAEVDLVAILAEKCFLGVARAEVVFAYQRKQKRLKGSLKKIALQNSNA